MPTLLGLLDDPSREQENIDKTVRMTSSWRAGLRRTTFTREMFRQHSGLQQHSKLTRFAAFRSGAGLRIQPA